MKICTGVVHLVTRTHNQLCKGVLLLYFNVSPKPSPLVWNRSEVPLHGFNEPRAIEARVDHCRENAPPCLLDQGLYLLIQSEGSHEI